MLEEVLTALQKVAAAQGRDDALRSQALEVLSLLTFAAQEDQSEISKTLAGLLIVAGESGGHPLIKQVSLHACLLQLQSACHEAHWLLAPLAALGLFTLPRVWQIFSHVLIKM